MVLKHTSNLCIFKFRKWLFSARFLDNPRWLLKLPYCSCFQFAVLRNHPDYQNTKVTLDEFESLMSVSEAWDFYKETEHKYVLAHDYRANYRDMFVKHALKQYNESFYYKCCDKNKTPDDREMFRSLLNYLYPIHPKPRSKEKNFWISYYKARNYVFSQFDKVSPISYQEAINVMPKNTGAGYVSMKYNNGLRLKKEEVLNDIVKQYKTNLSRIYNHKPVEDYCMFAMRGHLSDRLKKKTRPVWLVSASTIVSEIRFYQPFYDQINTKHFFRNMWITGKDSLPRLNKYLNANQDMTFYNTDISGWDSYRASWLHEDIMKELRKKINLTRQDFLEYNYCIESAIRTKVLFPNGHVWKKKAGIISGTAGTLLFNSLLNTIGSLTIMNMMKLYSLDGEYDFCSKIYWPNWLGDDFAFFSYHDIDLDKFADMSLTYLGVKLKPEKTIIAKPENLDDRKYLGYQLRGGFLYREEKELFQALLYMERPMSKEYFFSISFSRFFSYLLLGGINNYEFLNFFYFYCGKYKKYILDSDFHYRPGMDNIFKLLKDVWNISIPAFSLPTLRSMNFELMKYVLLYGHDLRFTELLQ